MNSQCDFLLNMELWFDNPFLGFQCKNIAFQLPQKFIEMNESQ